MILHHNIVSKIDMMKNSIDAGALAVIWNLDIGGYLHGPAEIEFIMKFICGIFKFNFNWKIFFERENLTWSWKLFERKWKICKCIHSNLPFLVPTYLPSFLWGLGGGGFNFGNRCQYTQLERSMLIQIDSNFLTIL